MGALPLTPAVEHDEAVAAAEVRDAAFGVACRARDAEPEYVHRRRGLQLLEAAEVSEARAATVGPDHERRAYFVVRAVLLVAGAAYHSALFNQLLDARAHRQLQTRITPRPFDDE